MRILVVLLMLLSSCVSLAGGPAPAAAPFGPPVMVKLFGLITDNTVGGLTLALEKVQDMTVKPASIFIEIDSPGGEYQAGFELSKAIESVPVPVICRVDGQASSMAFFVLQSCDIRISSGRSTLMIHETVMVGALHRKELSSLTRSMEVKNAALAHQCTKRAKVSVPDFLAKIAEGDWWMTPDEALKLGFIDVVN